MPEKELPYGIIALVVLAILIFFLARSFAQESKGFSKENFECKYLDYIPGVCTEEDKQRIEQERIQIQNTEHNNFVDKIAAAFKTCGENSQQQTCKCSLEFSQVFDNPIQIYKWPVGIFIKNFQTGYEKKIEGLTEIYINNRQNNIIPISSEYNTNFLYFITKETQSSIPGTSFGVTKSLQVITGTGQILIIELETAEDMNKIAIFKQGNKKGLYFPYLDSNSIINTECAKCGKGLLDVCDKTKCQEIAERTNFPCYYVDQLGYGSPGGTCYGDPRKFYEYELGTQNLVSNRIDIPDC